MRTFALSLSGVLAALLMTEPDQPGCSAPFADPQGCAESAVQGQAPNAGSADGLGRGSLGPGNYTIDGESLSAPSDFGKDGAGSSPAPGSVTPLNLGTGGPTIDLETLGSGTR